MKYVLRSNVFFLIILIIMIVGSIAVGLGASVFFLIFHKEVPMYVLLLITEFGFLLIPSILYLVITKQPFKKTLRLNPLNWKSILIVIGIMLFIQPLFMFLAAVTSLVFPNDMENLIQSFNSLPIWVMLFVMAITPAICEEVTIRGAILSGYEHMDLKKVALMNGLIFGLFHLNPSQFLYTFLAGILFVYFIEITGSLYASIIAHFTLNGTQVLYSRFALWVAQIQHVDMEQFANVTLQQQLASIVGIFILSLLFLPVVGLLFYLLLKVNGKTFNTLSVYGEDRINFSQETSLKEKMMNWPMYVSIAVYIIYSGVVQLMQYISHVMTLQ